MKPGVLQLVDAVLRFYVPGVLIFGVSAFLIWIVGAWLVVGRPDVTRAVFAMLAVLVMGYPLPGLRGCHWRRLAGASGGGGRGGRPGGQDHHRALSARGHRPRRGADCRSRPGAHGGVRETAQRPSPYYLGTSWPTRGCLAQHQVSQKGCNTLKASA